MGRRLPRHRTGRRAGLTRERHDRIIELVAAGNHQITAAQAVGIAESTFYRWLQQGRDAATARQEGEPLTPEAVAYLEFSEALTRARANAEIRAVAVVKKVMEGGYLVSEEETIGPDGTRKVKRVYAPADGRLALAYLARQSPERWGRQGVSRVEVTGSDSWQAKIEEDSAAARMAERLSEVLARRREEERRAASETGTQPG